ncbi:hypothetical protein EV665_12388 [Shinella granuli]|uniref:Uncharacterized protein n=1 Tax=Shinella granuli TaxID=323621 RepID=A0A4R2CDT1_SHIGR|nr:hypothetical protein EV665_12388 [Shinella granuli]
MRAASVTDRLDFGMRGRVVMLPDAVDTASENDAVLVDDEGDEGNATVVDMIHGEGDDLLHESRVARRGFGDHQACPRSFALSASFSQTTPAMMTPSQNAWINVSGWSSRMLPKTAAPTEPIPAHTA